MYCPYIYVTWSDFNRIKPMSSWYQLNHSIQAWRSNFMSLMGVSGNRLVCFSGHSVGLLCFGCTSLYNHYLIMKTHGCFLNYNWYIGHTQQIKVSFIDQVCIKQNFISLFTIGYMDITLSSSCVIVVFYILKYCWLCMNWGIRYADPGARCPVNYISMA